MLVGSAVGSRDGISVGSVLGAGDGAWVGTVGLSVGISVGELVVGGRDVGT